MPNRGGREQALAALARDLAGEGDAPERVDRLAAWWLWLGRRRRPWAAAARRQVLDEVMRLAQRPPGASCGPPLWGGVWALRVGRDLRGAPRIELW